MKPQITTQLLASLIIAFFISSGCSNKKIEEDPITDENLEGLDLATRIMEGTITNVSKTFRDRRRRTMQSIWFKSPEKSSDVKAVLCHSNCKRWPTTIVNQANLQEGNKIQVKGRYWHRRNTIYFVKEIRLKEESSPDTNPDTSPDTTPDNTPDTSPDTTAEPGPNGMFVWVQPLDHRVRRSDSPRATTEHQLYSARNEWESVQIGVRSPNSGTVAVTGGNWPEGIQSRIYRERQFQLTRKSYGGSRNSWFKPDWYGDILFSESSMQLPSNQTHAFLVDLYVPNGTPPGDYESTYFVGTQPVKVKLHVWNFTLPKRAHLKTDFGKIGQYERYWPSGIQKYGSNTDEDMARILSQNRINPLAGGIQNWSQNEFSNFDSKYPLNAVRIGGIGEQSRTDMQKGKALADSIGVPAYVYVADEPDDWDGFPTTNRRISNMSSYGLDVSMMVTDGPSNGLSGVDIWCDNFRRFDANATAQAINRGDEVWQYTALSRWELDYPLSQFRIWSWITKRHKMTGFLYWRITKWNDDPLNDPLSYTNSAGREFFGEGALVFPYNGSVIPSVRLKVIRDAIEDFDYMTMAGVSPDPGTDDFLGPIGGDEVSDRLLNLRKQLGESLSGE